MSPKRRPMPQTFAEYQTEWWPRLENHMWLEHWTFTHYINRSDLHIAGLLKPQPNEGGGRVVRRMFMDVLDQALDELADLGAAHTRHPDVRIRGEALHAFDKPDDFAFLRCEVDFHLVVKH